MTSTTQTNEHAFSGLANHKPDVQRFLDRLCRALTHGDVAKIVSCWDVPAYVLSDDGVHAVNSTEEVAQFFGGAKEQCNTRGVTETRPIIERQQWLTDKIVSVDVRWPWIGANGEDKGEERSSYTLRVDEHGHLRLHVAVMRGATER